MILEGQAPITGDSLMITLNVQLAELLEASVAVQLTVVVPVAKVLPEAGVHTTVVGPQLSEAVAVKTAT